MDFRNTSTLKLNSFTKKRAEFSVLSKSCGDAIGKTFVLILGMVVVLAVIFRLDGSEDGRRRNSVLEPPAIEIPGKGVHDNRMGDVSESINEIGRTDTFAPLLHEMPDIEPTANSTGEMFLSTFFTQDRSRVSSFCDKSEFELIKIDRLHI